MTTKAWQRANDRAADALRPLCFEPDIQPQAYASLLISTGATQVVCAVSLEEAVPPFLESTGQGWITAEYAMLPGATSSRNRRETAGRSGRSMEIQRLIGRSLRQMVDLTRLCPYTLRVDCDVLNADGGTRTAAITGAALAVRAAVGRMVREHRLPCLPLLRPVAAVSVGLVDGEVLLDLDYREDARAEADGNFVMAGGDWVEIQVSAEGRPLSDVEFVLMKDAARAGIETLQSLWQRQDLDQPAARA
jgi:ribonuclease PH